MVGLLTAMYVVLSLYLTVTLWNYKLTFEALPILICALMYGPADGFLVGFLGSFLNQMLTYGFTSTTLLWVLPHAASGLFAGWLGKRIKRPLKPAVTCLVTVSSALAVTALNDPSGYFVMKGGAEHIRHVCGQQSERILFESVRFRSARRQVADRHRDGCRFFPGASCSSG